MENEKFYNELFLKKKLKSIIKNDFSRGDEMRKRIPKEVRKKVFDKCDGHCAYCGCEISEKGFHIDHLLCIRNNEDKEGVNVHSEENLMPSCVSCNKYKATMDLETFREQLEKIPERLRRDESTYRIALRYGMVQEKKEAIKFYFEKSGGYDGVRRL